ncbi:hypothetical protein AB0M46_15940 [Dactylosporangium sp. NPDC051485]|uniref:hypothetical protein n=1 Tax=Dactylosporangium sp. NPDC051485 TaxID=3154846 RepID=UPI00342502D6
MLPLARSPTCSGCTTSGGEDGADGGKGDVTSGGKDGEDGGEDGVTSGGKGSADGGKGSVTSGGEDGAVCDGAGGAVCDGAGGAVCDGAGGAVCDGAGGAGSRIEPSRCSPTGGGVSPRTRRSRSACRLTNPQDRCLAWSWRNCSIAGEYRRDLVLSRMAANSALVNNWSCPMHLTIPESSRNHGPEQQRTMANGANRTPAAPMRATRETRQGG